MTEQIQVRVWQPVEVEVRTYMPRLCRWVRQRLVRFTSATVQMAYAERIEPDVQLIDAPMHPRRRKKIDRAYAILREHGPMTYSDLAERLDCSRGTIQELSKMEAGIVEVPRTGGKTLVALPGQIDEQQTRYEENALRLYGALREHGPLTAQAVALHVDMKAGWVRVQLRRHEGDLFRIYSMQRKPGGGPASAVWEAIGDGEDGR